MEFADAARTVTPAPFELDRASLTQLPRCFRQPRMQAPVLPQIPCPNSDDDSETRGIMLSTLSVNNVSLVSLLASVRLFTIVSDASCSFSSSLRMASSIIFLLHPRSPLLRLLYYFL